MMVRIIYRVVFLALTSNLAFAAESQSPALVDMEGFLAETAEAAELRSTRLVRLDAFLELAAQPDTLVLDTRSQAAYDSKHLAGAVHLNFSDFTADKLAAVIPTKSTRVLIYCNNNLGGDARNFPAKQLKLALNLPTFVNLYGYGYRNVYELSTYVSVEDPRLVFAGTDVGAAAPAGPPAAKQLLKAH